MTTHPTPTIPKGWRRLPMTKAQADRLDELHVRYDSNTTRGEASDLITREVEMTDHPFSEDALGQF